MTSEALIEKAVVYMSTLANGVNPYTGEKLTPADFESEKMKRLFAFVAAKLTELLGTEDEDAEEGAAPAVAGYGASAESRPRRAFFRAEDVPVEKIEISETPIGVNVLAGNVRAVFDVGAMRSLSGASIADWLVAQGYLKLETVGGKTRKTLGARYAELGLSSRECSNPETGEPYVQILYPPRAQRFVIAHLKDISCWLTARRKSRLGVREEAAEYGVPANEDF